MSLTTFGGAAASTCRVAWVCLSACVPRNETPAAAVFALSRASGAVDPLEDSTDVVPSQRAGRTRIPAPSRSHYTAGELDANAPRRVQEPEERAQSTAHAGQRPGPHNLAVRGEELIDGPRRELSTQENQERNRRSLGQDPIKPGSQHAGFRACQEASNPGQQAPRTLWCRCFYKLVEASHDPSQHTDFGPHLGFDFGGT